MELIDTLSSSGQLATLEALAPRLRDLGYRVETYYRDPAYMRVTPYHWRCTYFKLARECGEQIASMARYFGSFSVTEDFELKSYRGRPWWDVVWRVTCD
jgi:hypothetical protein